MMSLAKSLKLFQKPLLNPVALYSTERFYQQLLKSCNGLLSLEQIHSALTTTGLVKKNTCLGANIILKYAKFGQLEAAQSLFDEMPVRNLVCWSNMMFGYKQAKKPKQVLGLYQKMKKEGVFEDSVILVNVASAIGQLRDAALAQAVHGGVIKGGFGSDLYVGAAMVETYAKSGELYCGRRTFDEILFRDLVCWTAMITAYEQAEQPREALVLFREMQQKCVFADSVTLISVASAVGQLRDAKSAEAVHAYAICSGFLGDVSVANALVTMHAKCGNTQKAHLVFDRMDDRDTISWNAVLSSYIQNGKAGEALSLFDEMLDSECKPDSITALIMVSACAYLCSGDLGRKFHDFIINTKMKIDVNLRNALMDMYAKCGDLDATMEIFNQIHQSERDVKSWNVLISGYGMHGHGEKALEFFLRMKEEGIKPDHVAFISILSACSHAGLIDEGRKCFAEMKKFAVTPQGKHYACMVDMLGRAGFLDEAYDLIRKMPSQPDDSVWSALLLACRIYGNTKLGDIAASSLFQLKPEHAGCYVLMSNVKAASNRWEEVGELRQEMKNKGLMKPVALSMVEFGKEV